MKAGALLSHPTMRWGANAGFRRVKVVSRPAIRRGELSYVIRSMSFEDFPVLLTKREVF